jgi:hypothetical protein
VELLSLLRALWRHRILVGLGVVAATAVGLAIASGGGSRSGIAEARVVLDTPRSQLVEAVAIGADTLGWRASLLADLMSSRPVRTRIAHDSHIPEDSLVVVAPYLSVPAKPTALAKLGLDASAATPEPYVLSVGRTAGVPFDAPLPLISIKARAPDPTKATRLANAATAALIAAAATPESTPDIHRSEIQQFVVESVGPARAHEVVEGSRVLVALAVAILLLGLWGCCIALVSGVVRSRRFSGPIQPAG